MIYKFADKYEFLSNFYSVNIKLNGKDYKSIEHAYQANKTKDEAEHEWVRNAPTASKAKSFGKKVRVRKNWDGIKYRLMLKLVRSKFKHPELRSMLLETINEEIIEGNYWHDNEWGNCTCSRCEEIEGKNWLGEILMKVRQEIKDEIELFN